MQQLKLKMAIFEAGRTQRWLTRQVPPPMSENRMSDIVQGWVDPTPQERLAISTALGKTPDQLFAETDVSRELVNT